MENFENDSVAVEVETEPGCQVQLKVHVKPKACEEANKQAIKAIRSRVSLPGFRKGKAPEAMIKQSYHAAIEQEWKDAVVNMGLRECLKLTEIYPWSGEGVPSPDIESTSLEEGSRMTFKFEREPDIPEIKGEELQLKKEKEKTIGEKEVSEEIDGLRKRNATFEESEGKVERGGFCRIDVESLEEEKPVMMVADHRVEVKEGDLAEWLIALIEGKKAGETAEGETAPPADAPEEHKKNFKSVPVRVTIKGVDEEVLPDDETLTKQLRLESMDELKMKTQGRLENEEKQRVETELKQLLWKTLREKYPFELPSSLVAAEKQATIQRMIAERQQAGQTKEEIIAQEKEIEQMAMVEIAQRLQTIFMARKITADAKNQPTEKDVQQRVSELLLWDSLSRGQVPSKTDMDPQQAAGYRNKAFLMLIQEKAEEHLLEKATIS